jgi:hypothetical protein
LGARTQATSPTIELTPDIGPSAGRPSAAAKVGCKIRPASATASISARLYHPGWQLSSRHSCTRRAGLEGLRLQDSRAGLEGPRLQDNRAGLEGPRLQDSRAGLEGPRLQDSRAGLGGARLQGSREGCTEATAALPALAGMVRRPSSLAPPPACSTSRMAASIRATPARLGGSRSNAARGSRSGGHGASRYAPPLMGRCRDVHEGCSRAGRGTAGNRTAPLVGALARIPGRRCGLSGRVARSAQRECEQSRPPAAQQGTAHEAVGAPP